MAKPKRSKRRTHSVGGQRPPSKRSTTAAQAASGIASPVVTRQRVQGARNQRRYEKKRSRWSVPMPILVSVGGTLVVVAIFFAIAHGRSSATGAKHETPTASVLSAVEHPDSTIFAKVGAGTSVSNLFQALPNKSGTDLPPQNGKPVLFYAGGEYCPFCAADRWALIMALSRFGTFLGIETNASSTIDIYPGTPTFTFAKATYTSPYLIFDPKEILGATNSTPLQSLTAAESKVFDTYDVPPYDSTPDGIPFMDFGGLYVATGGSYNVGVLHITPSDNSSGPLTYTQIVTALTNPNSAIARAIVGTANEYTAAICTMTDNANKSVCLSGTIPQLESQLPSR
jgi:hypothetical protein